MTRSWISFCLLMLVSAMAMGQYPKNVQLALQQTATNRHELQKALDHFYKSGDRLKIKAINFLVGNMPIHYSYNYFWVDKAGKKIPFNELQYKTVNDAINAFLVIERKYGGLRPIPYRYRDIDSIKANMLIDNVELAVAAYNEQCKIKKIDEADFLEYVLPYRTCYEPLQDWRKLYLAKFATEFSAGQSADMQWQHLKKTIGSQVRNLWSAGKKKEPLPRLGALQILFRGNGYCEDIAALATLIARSKGIPAAVDNIPAWATATGSHAVTYIKCDAAHTHFDGVDLDPMYREPSKVLRTTYSAQPGTLANTLDTVNIPDGLLRLKNYKDVTDEYWQTENITVQAVYKEAANTPGNVIYLAVLNGGQWMPVWYGKKQGTSVTFTKMCKGAVYLPMYYKNKKLSAASWPYALGYKNRLELKPDFQNTHSIRITEQEKYLQYQSGKKYRLCMWNNQWQVVGEKTAPVGCRELVFEKVPKNALLVLIPEYTQGKERPFMITDNGEQVWW